MFQSYSTSFLSECSSQFIIIGIIVGVTLYTIFCLSTMSVKRQAVVVYLESLTNTAVSLQPVARTQCAPLWTLQMTIQPTLRLILISAFGNLPWKVIPKGLIASQTMMSPLVQPLWVFNQLFKVKGFSVTPWPLKALAIELTAPPFSHKVTAEVPISQLPHLASHCLNNGQVADDATITNNITVMLFIPLSAQTNNQSLQIKFTNLFIDEQNFKQQFRKMQSKQHSGANFIESCLSNTSDCFLPQISPLSNNKSLKNIIPASPRSERQIEKLRESLNKKERVFSFRKVMGSPAKECKLTIECLKQRAPSQLFGQQCVCASNMRPISPVTCGHSPYSPNQSTVSHNKLMQQSKVSTANNPGQEAHLQYMVRALQLQDHIREHPTYLEKDHGSYTTNKQLIFNHYQKSPNPASNLNIINSNAPSPSKNITNRLRFMYISPSKDNAISKTNLNQEQKPKTTDINNYSSSRFKEINHLSSLKNQQNHTSGIIEWKNGNLEQNRKYNLSNSEQFVGSNWSTIYKANNKEENYFGFYNNELNLEVESLGTINHQHQSQLIYDEEDIINKNQLGILQEKSFLFSSYDKTQPSPHISHENDFKFYSTEIQQKPYMSSKVSVLSFGSRPIKEMEIEEEQSEEQNIVDNVEHFINNREIKCNSSKIIENFKNQLKKDQDFGKYHSRNTSGVEIHPFMSINEHYKKLKRVNTIESFDSSLSDNSFLDTRFMRKMKNKKQISRLVMDSARTTQNKIKFDEILKLQQYSS